MPWITNSDWVDDDLIEEERHGYNSDLLHTGDPRSIVSLQLGLALINASRNLPYLSDAPLRVPRGESIAWLRDQFLLPSHSNKYRDWIAASDPCESPIELVAFLGLCAGVANRLLPLAVVAPEVAGLKPVLADRMVVVHVALQEMVGKYRIDLSLHFNCRIGDTVHQRHIAVECDGHEYHKNRRQQDSEKDAFLQSRNFRVFRFAGKQIWNDIAGCSWAVIRWLFNDFRRTYFADVDSFHSKNTAENTPQPSTCLSTTYPQCQTSSP